MPAALLALALLTVITFDPRLEEPLRLLAEVRDRDGELVGTPYVARARDPKVALLVWDLPEGHAGRHIGGTWGIKIAKAMLYEDPRAIATVLVHELRHSIDLEDGVSGTWHPDCTYLEARAYEDQAIVARAFWPDELPSGTVFERDLAAWVRTYEAGNLLVENPSYQPGCAEENTSDWTPGRLTGSTVVAIAI